MDDATHPDDDSRWLTGFEGDRRVVLAKIGPYRRLFLRPQHHTPRLHHRIYDLAIEDWRLPLDAPRLGPLCSLTASLSIRFQPTLAFAREHIEQIANLGTYIRSHYRALLQDAAEQALQSLESSDWLEQGHEAVQVRIEDIVHELLAIRGIQSRCRCRIEVSFNTLDPSRLEEDLNAIDTRRSRMARQILRHQRTTAERSAHEQLEQHILNDRLRLERQERLVELLKEETRVRQRHQEQESALAREDLKGEEARQLERLESEIRQRLERVRHEHELKRLELESAFEEKVKHSAIFDEVHAHLQREIEMLAMERQRLTLEEEIQSIKKTRATGWLGDLRSRLTSDGKS